MNTKKLVGLVVTALVLFFLITQPVESAEAVQRVLAWLRQGAEAVVTFVKGLFS